MGLLHKKNQQKNKDHFIRLLTPMIAGVLACVFCLVSMTWAWFTASVDTPKQAIQSANRNTSVMVYEISQSTDKDGNKSETRELKMPKAEDVSLLSADSQAEENAGVIIADEAVVWELKPERSYEVILRGGGTASMGYCTVQLSHTVSGSNTPETKLYTTSAFAQEKTIKFTYNTGGFSGEEGITATQWKEYVEKTASPTLTIASHWGNPAKEVPEQVSLMSVRETEEYMLLSDGDVLGLAPIPCPEAKAETEMDLEGFEMEEGTVISAEEDHQISLTLKEGYEMPDTVVVNIDGKDYIVSTLGAEANEKAPYYDVETGILTVPAAILHDGATVYVQATATPIPEEPEAEREEETEEETGEETTEETETEETPAAEEPEDSIIEENPAKKEEDEEEEGKLSVNPVKTSSGNGGRDDDTADSETEDDAEDEENADSDSTADDNTSDEDDALAEARNEKIDVSFTLAQLTIDLEKTNLPANADLVLTLAAKEGEEYPEQFVITLDKTVRDEDNEDEEIEEDKTEYTINADGEDNPEGFVFDAETGELTIESELLVGVRAITIADAAGDETVENEEENILPFEVKNLTFAFADEEFVTEEDVVITFTAGEGYALPETIIITIDDEVYTIYTSEEDSEENPEGITFDAEKGTLTISKDLLEDAETISITAEAVKIEEEESEEGTENDEEDSEGDGENEENGTGSSKEEDETEEDNTTEGGPDPGNDDNTGTENGDDTSGDESGDDTSENENGDDTGLDDGTGSSGNEGGESTDTENGDAVEGEDETKTEGGEDTGSTDTEPIPDDTTEGTDEPTGTEDGTDSPATTNPEDEEESGNEQGGESGSTEENGENVNGTGESTESASGTESGSGDETTTPAESTTPAGSNSSAVEPESSKTEGSETSDAETSGNHGDNGSTESDGTSESTTSSSPSVVPAAPTTSAPATSETSTPGASKQTSSNMSPSTPAPTPSTDSGANEASPSSDTTGSKETSSEE